MVFAESSGNGPRHKVQYQSERSTIHDRSQKYEQVPLSSPKIIPQTVPALLLSCVDPGYRVLCNKQEQRMYYPQSIL